jgi:hypothetical protein
MCLIKYWSSTWNPDWFDDEDSHAKHTLLGHPKKKKKTTLKTTDVISDKSLK